MSNVIKPGVIAKVIGLPPGVSKQATNKLVLIQEADIPKYFSVTIYKAITIDNNQGYSLLCWFAGEHIEYVCENKEKLTKIERLIYGIRE